MSIVTVDFIFEHKLNAEKKYPYKSNSMSESYQKTDEMILYSILYM